MRINYTKLSYEINYYVFKGHNTDLFLSLKHTTLTSCIFNILKKVFYQRIQTSKNIFRLIG